MIGDIVPRTGVWQMMMLKAFDCLVNDSELSSVFAKVHFTLPATVEAVTVDWSTDKV